MQNVKRPIAYWVIVVFLALSIIVMLTGQTTAVFNYDLAARIGLQESAAQVGDYGVQVNRAFGAGDTVVYIPLMAVSVVGLVLRKRWALMTTAAAVGVSAYWSVTIGSMLVFLPAVSGYSLVPGPEYWLFIAAYVVFGAWGLFYLMFRGDALLR
ncbi:MAG: hypothetical protein ACYSU7_10045 [Planctomycetota bacterium]|jgi:hypothetical protein